MITPGASLKNLGFQKSHCNARNWPIYAYGYYAIARAVVPFQGWRTFAPSSIGGGSFSMNNSWPILYRRITETWVNVSGTTVRVREYQDYFQAGGLDAEIITTGSGVGAGDYRSISNVVTDTTISSSGLTGTYFAQLDARMDFDDEVAKCLLFLNSQSGPAFYNFDTFPGSGLKNISFSHEVRYYKTAGGAVTAQEEGITRWGGVAALGVVGYINPGSAAIEVFGLSSIEDQITNDSGGPPNFNVGFLNSTAFIMCARSSWYIRNTNVLAPTAFLPTPAHTNYVNNHLNIYCLTFAADPAPVSTYSADAGTSQPNPIYSNTQTAPVAISQPLDYPQTVTFTPEDVLYYISALGSPRRFGEFGFRITPV